MARRHRALRPVNPRRRPIRAAVRTYAGPSVGKVTLPVEKPADSSAGGRVVGGSWGTPQTVDRRKRRASAVVKAWSRAEARRLAKVRNPHPRHKGRNTGASQVTNKKKHKSSLVSPSDQGGGVSPVTNGPGGGDITGGLFDSLTATLSSGLRFAALAILVYLAWKYGRKYLKR